MNIKINGKPFDIDENTNVFGILEVYGIKDISYTAIEYNNQILKKDLWEKTILEENDEIEIVSFVGGG